MDCPPPSSALAKIKARAQPRFVKFGPGPMGLTLSPASGCTIVTKLVPGGPAVRSKSVKLNDVLVSLNNRYCPFMVNTTVIASISHTARPITLGCMFAWRCSLQSFELNCFLLVTHVFTLQQPFLLQLCLLQSSQIYLSTCLLPCHGRRCLRTTLALK